MSVEGGSQGHWEAETGATEIADSGASWQGLSGWGGGAEILHRLLQNASSKRNHVVYACSRTVV